MEISNLRPVPVYSTSTNVLNQPWGKFCFGKVEVDTFLNTSTPGHYISNKHSRTLTVAEKKAD